MRGHVANRSPDPKASGAKCLGLAATCLFKLHFCISEGMRPSFRKASMVAAYGYKYLQRASIVFCRFDVAKFISVTSRFGIFPQLANNLLVRRTDLFGEHKTDRLASSFQNNRPRRAEKSEIKTSGAVAISFTFRFSRPRQVEVGMHTILARSLIEAPPKVKVIDSGPYQLTHLSGTDKFTLKHRAHARMQPGNAHFTLSPS